MMQSIINIYYIFILSWMRTAVIFFQFVILPNAIFFLQNYKYENFENTAYELVRMVSV
jgi:hypothetical protein